MDIFLRKCILFLNLRLSFNDAVSIQTTQRRMIKQCGADGEMSIHEAEVLMEHLPQCHFVLH
jgi:hypothetical protein